MGLELSQPLAVARHLPRDLRRPSALSQKIQDETGSAAKGRAERP